MHSHKTLIAAVMLSAITIATANPAQQRRGTRGDETGQRRGETGQRRGAPQERIDPRIQKRDYVLSETSERIEYDVFVSSKVDKKKKSPLVIALHGLGVSPATMLGFVLDAAQSGGYIVAAPTGYNLEGWYGARGPTSPDSTPRNLGELSEKDVMNVLARMRDEFNVDENRIYLLGQSMGGAGALYLGVKHHETWAAVGATAPAAASARLQPTILDAVPDLPMILVQGDADESVPVTLTRRWADKMNELKMTHDYYEIKGAGHRDAITQGAGRVFAFFSKHTRGAPAAQSR